MDFYFILSDYARGAKAAAERARFAVWRALLCCAVHLLRTPTWGTKLRGMAPIFDEDGIAAGFGCPFSLRATGDNTIYWLLRPAEANKPFEVKAKYAGLTKAQFDTLLRELSKRRENIGSKTLSNAAHRTQFFDDAFENALGRRDHVTDGAHSMRGSLYSEGT